MVFSLSSMVSERFTTFGVDLGVGSASDSITLLVADMTVIYFCFSWRCSFSVDWLDGRDGADPEEMDLMNCLIILSLNFCCCLPARLAISLCCKARVIEPLLPELWTLGTRLDDGEGFCTNGESTFTIAALVVV